MTEIKTFDNLEYTDPDICREEVYFMTANRVAKEIRTIIDDYWLGKLTDWQAKKSISAFMVNPELHLKIQRGNEFTSVFKSVMGVRRLKEFERIISS